MEIYYLESIASTPPFWIYVIIERNFGALHRHPINLIKKL